MRVVVLLVAALLLPSVGALPVLDNDAGSGGDAPGTRTGAVAITPGTVYDGTFTPPSDTVDFYAFPATNGESIDVTVWPGVSCAQVFTPSGALRASVCVASAGTLLLQTTANVTGTWYVSISQPVRGTTPYRFAVAVDTSAPDPTPSGVPSLTGVRFIQPGELVQTPQGSCTLNFVYNGTGSKAGKVYIGTAAHCFGDVGETASIPGVGNIGTVVYMGDYQGANVPTYENGIPGEQLDFALIEVDSALHGRVKGEVKGHPGLPTALKAHSTARVGDRFLFSGYGTGFGLTQPTREERQGIYTLSSAKQWTGLAPIMPGDSGGPVLHQDGRAIGVATHVGAFGAGGPWLDSAMGEATQHGFPITLRPAY